MNDRTTCDVDIFLQLLGKYCVHIFHVRFYADDVTVNEERL